MITIVGLGALGSHCAQFLRNHELRVVDFDHVEMKNTQSQFHGVPSVRANKARAFAGVIATLWKVKVQVRTAKLGTSNVAELLGGSDLVVDATDNPDARNEIQGYCKLAGVPCLHLCISADGGFGRVVWSECFTADDVDGDGATCEDGANLPMHALIASVGADAAQNFLSQGERRSLEIVPGSIRRVA